MKLADWFKKEGTTACRFARAHGKPKMTVYRHARGWRMPGREYTDFYFVVSQGAVTPNDFYGIAQASPSPESAPATEAAA